MRRLFLWVISISLFIGTAHAYELRNKLNFAQWSYQAFSPEDKSTIEEVLKSDGGMYLIKVNSIAPEAKLTLDDVDTILYDCGLFDVLENKDELYRMMLVNQAKIGPFSKLARKYKDRDQLKLRKLYDLFLHD